MHTMVHQRYGELLRNPQLFNTNVVPMLLSIELQLYAKNTRPDEHCFFDRRWYSGHQE
jgi:hypothetical protein